MAALKTLLWKRLLQRFLGLPRQKNDSPGS